MTRKVAQLRNIFVLFTRIYYLCDLCGFWYISSGLDASSCDICGYYECNLHIVTILYGLLNGSKQLFSQ